ncbi:phosphopantetheine-binding protein [Luteibacter sp. 22Crub2.1]|uniref:phosphopantetheine-binding protein n=2 Tax=Lysobacterales TaxID=135614 RepID=UPI0026DB53F3|nr:phosphopantetheine-binding protein [Luteibacter sp. 22Crub2.1]
MLHEAERPQGLAPGPCDKLRDRCHPGGGRKSRTWKHSMATQTAAQHELAELIVTSLNLESVQPADIDPEAPLFGGDLGLDSIDALEIALAVSKRYGFQLKSDNPDNRTIFTSLRTLSEHIEQHRAAA